MCRIAPAETSSTINIDKKLVVTQPFQKLILISNFPSPSLLLPFHRPLASSILYARSHTTDFMKGEGNTEEL